MQSRYSIVPSEFFTNIFCAALVCSKKYRYSARHNLYIPMLVVSEPTAGYSIKTVFVHIKIPSKFTGIWGNGLVSPSKTHIIPEKNCNDPKLNLNSHFCNTLF